MVRRDIPILWIPVGVVGAGKTTFALKLWKISPNRLLRVSLDDIIQMMSFYGYQRELSLLYGAIEELGIIKGLIRGHQVYVDRTNLTPEIRKRFIGIAQKIEATAQEALKIWEVSLEAGVDPEREITEYLTYTSEETDQETDRDIKEFMRETLFGPKYPTLIPEAMKLEDPQAYLEKLSNIEKVFIYFEIDPKLALERRQRDPYAPLRELTGRKIDWSEVLNNMLKMMSVPKKEEGFSRGYRIDQEGNIEEIV